MTKIYFHLSLLLSIIFFTSCATLTGYQDGRAIGKESVEVLGSINYTQTPDFDVDLNFDSIANPEVPSFGFPNIEFGAKYGVTDKLDVLVRANTNLNLNVGAKYQLLGTNESLFALGAGAEVGTFGLITTFWNVQVPVYASLHPTENISIYLSPRYTYQFSSTFAAGGITYLGGNFGLLFGRKNKIGVDVGYANADIAGSASLALLTFGVGGRFLILDNAENRNGAPDRNMPTKKKKRRR